MSLNIDIERLAEEGPQRNVPCGECEKPSRSHVLHSGKGGTFRELSGEDPFAGVPPGKIVRLCIVCHSCYVELEDMRPGERAEWSPKPNAGGQVKVVANKK